MKIYLFYYIPFEDYVNTPATLYAYTDSKDIYEEFKIQRNMKKFKCVKEDISKKDFKEFESKHGKMKLSYNTFKTKSKIYGRMQNVDVLCTWIEEESIFKMSDSLWKEYSKHLFDCRLFKKKYIQVLEKLLFIKFYTFYRVNAMNELMDYYYEPYYNSYGPTEDFVMEDFKRSFQYDELKIFLKLYSDKFDFKKETI